MKIKKENFVYSCRPINYILLHLSKPIPNNCELNRWPIGLWHLRGLSIFEDSIRLKGLPDGLEKAQKLREEIKKIDGIKAVYVDEYEIYLELTPALMWNEVSDKICSVIKTFFNENTIELITKNN